MVDYSIYPLPKAVMKELKKLEVTFAFQPIRNADWDIVAYEALMRPADCTVLDLIKEYHEKDMLHVIEVATFFGAFQEYEKRGIAENVCVNSFPGEVMTDAENKAFNEAFPVSKKNGIIELIGFPIENYGTWDKKKKQLAKEDVYFSLGDFGVGINSMKALEIYKPNLVKLDRTLVWDIEEDIIKQANCRLLTEAIHEKGVMVLAEGVETEEAYNYMKSIGVDLFQGYFIGRPE